MTGFHVEPDFARHAGGTNREFHVERAMFASGRPFFAIPRKATPLLESAASQRF